MSGLAKRWTGEAEQGVEGWAGWRRRPEEARPAGGAAGGGGVRSAGEGGTDFWREEGGGKPRKAVTLAGGISGSGVREWAERTGVGKFCISDNPITVAMGKSGESSSIFGGSITFDNFSLQYLAAVNGPAKIGYYFRWPT
jgi:hypothetical protein